MNKTKKTIGIMMLAAGILAASLVGTPAPAQADIIWDHWQKAEALSASGEQEAAAVHWKFLADHYASAGEWENAALFCGKLDAYYDAIGDYDQAIHYYELENEYWVKAGRDWGAVKLQRADQIRTTVELYRKESGEASVRELTVPANGKLAKFEPAYGTYLGMYAEQDPKVGNMFTKNESVYGKKHAIYLAYAHWGQGFPATYAKRAKEAGGALQIAWEPDDGLDPVTDGDYLRKWARDAKAAGIPIFLRFAGEMNGAWVKWHGNPAQYIAKFRMLHDVFAAEAPNVAMVWSPGDVPANDIDPYYPGDAYVDWVGVSLYIEPYENGDPSLPSMLATSNVERLTRLYDTYADRKPLMLSETGVPHYSYATGEDFTEWAKLNLQRLYEIMPYKYPRLKAITYFNVNQQTDNAKNDYSLSSSSEIQSYYAKLIANPYLLSKVADSAKPADNAGYVPVDADHQPFTKRTKVVPFVKIPEVYIGKVEYLLNGRVVASQTELPYGLELRAGEVPEGSVLQIRVWNKAGQEVALRTFGISSQVSVEIDGKEQSFEQAPAIVNGSTLTPLRAIFEAMGASVEYEASSRTVTAKKGSATVRLTLDQKTVYVNGSAVQLEEPARLINGYTLAPARFVGETFGGRVSWDGSSRTVTITTK
ncbi:stalk domain-containing protein [Paenibacillus sp. GCM10023248]|uniref:stalk domain-containing protein n=1 Tax=unclassified Paenibacillus TaxID=185978 RepID=UPI002378C058|nr:stalk domain-containing protein [Paenibacillus sp. MAHUQ-63]MDD9268681.1 stalk domain-containing protein [Paenibacillus sp. MAHUQ-63]